MFEPYQASRDVEVIPSYFPIPGFGIVPVNAFLLRAKEPVMVDAGLVPLTEDFMRQLSSLIDLTDLRWLWLTHTDQDHIGSLERLLDAAPKLKVITTFLGLGKMSLFRPLPVDRVHLLNPGQSITAGDRTLTAIKPPSYDAPETTGLFDSRSGAFFSSDCFGALLSRPAEDAADIRREDLREGMLTWTKVDSPWLHMVDADVFAQALDRVRQLSPRLILSGHLPPAQDMTDMLLKHLAEVPRAEPFLGPDQEALETKRMSLTGG
jgi:flavorubredoxin